MALESTQKKRDIIFNKTNTTVLIASRSSYPNIVEISETEVFVNALFG